MTSTYPLGDYTVRRVGYGAMQLPGPGVMGPPRDHDEAIRVLRRALELGVDHIDTAQFYGPDVANDLIREALHPYPDDLAIVSKVGARRNAEGHWLAAQEPARLREDVEANLTALGTERLAAVNLRLMPEHEGVPDVRLEDQLAEMVALREEGKIGGVGISTADLAQVETAIRLADIVTVQNPFSLVDRHDADVLALTREHGVSYAPYFPLGSAFPQNPKVVDVPAVRAVAARRGVSPSQVGLAWLLHRSPNILLIPGTSSVAHLEENLAVGDLDLAPEELDEIESASPTS